MASINTNISAYYAQNNLRTAANAAQASIARLSSGNAIVQASDNVAALSIGTILRTTVSTLKTASTNASQGTTLLQVADGALGSLGDILQRQKALAVQANSGTLSDNERSYLNQEFQSLASEYDRIVSTTNFNNVNLLDGSISGGSDLRGAASSAQVIKNLPTTGNTVSAATLGGTLNDSITGDLSDAVVTIKYLTGSTDDITVTTHGVTFVGKALDLHTAGGPVTLTASTGATLALTTTGSSAVATDQTTANTQAAAIQSDLRQATVYQTRAIINTAGKDYAIDADKFDGTVLQGMDGSSFVLKSNAFNSDALETPAISGFAVSKYSSSQNGKISVNINGDVYSLKLTSATLAASTAYTLTNESDSNSTFIITTGAGNTVNVDTDTGVAALTDALNKGFGTGSAGGLTFQVGNNSSDTIGITVKNIGTSSVYKDNSGAVQILDIGTQAGAITASDVLDNAIQTVTSARADVGALQSRFNYASATLSTSIQNLDSARGQFLDTDVSAESTKFATEQVLQQAAISVLAQANQIPQNLLKLIG